MTRGDDLVERASVGLRGLADRAAARGGVGAKVADALADDAAFVRKLKPSLIVARARGQAPTDGKPSDTAVIPPRPQPPATGAPAEGGGASGGPNPFAVVGGALAGGIVLAKLIDWRSHAHPRL
jgi:hypothetical protein